MPERKAADLVACDLVYRGYVKEEHLFAAAGVLRDHMERTRGRRGLKDHEAGELANAVRDAVRPVCGSDRLRGLVVTAICAKLRGLGLLYDHARTNDER